MKRITHLALGALVSSLAVSLEAQICPAFAQRQATAYDLAQPFASIYLESRGVTFRIPSAYLQWSSKDLETLVATTSESDPKRADAFRIAFWISDRKPPFRRRGLTNADASWPPEVGRPNSGTSDFVVEVDAIENVPLGEAPAQILLPQRMFQNLVSGMKQPAVTNRDGLTCYEVRAFDNSTVRACRPNSNDGDEVLLRLFLPEPAPPFPAWQVSAFLPEHRLSFILWVPGDALFRWNEALSSAVELIQSWRIGR